MIESAFVQCDKLTSIVSRNKRISKRAKTMLVGMFTDTSFPSSLEREAYASDNEVCELARDLNPQNIVYVFDHLFAAEACCSMKENADA